MTEQHNEPLISPPAEGTVVNMGPVEGDSSKRAFKIAGFTMLACLLIAGQGLTAYFLLNQQSQIGNLEDNTHMLQEKMKQQPSGSSGVKTMHVVRQNMPMLIDYSSDTKDPEPKHTREPSTQNKCLQQFMLPMLNGFVPRCDELGNYLPMQCQQKTGTCWCVTKDGTPIDGSMTQGIASCGGDRGLGRIPAMPAMPSMQETKDE